MDPKEPVKFAFPQPSAKRLLEERERMLRERAEAFAPVKKRLESEFPGSEKVQSEEAATTEEGRALLTAKQDYDEAVAEEESWGDETPLETPFGPAPQRTCGHETLDRECKACGCRYCSECQPEVSGAKCLRCEGPVWGDDQPKPAEQRNPAMRKNY